MISDVVTVNPNVQGGTPCFKGTRVPVSSLYDHLEQGFSLNEFLADFPTVAREQAIAVLDVPENMAPSDAPRKRGR